MFIVEGPDGGGKTTLIRRLQEELKFEVMPRPCTSEDGIDMTTLKDWVLEDLSRPIHDRGFYDRYPLISEPIYGPLLRGRMADGFSDWAWMAKTLAIFNHREPVIVFCLPPKQRVIDNIIDAHDADTDHQRGVVRQAEALYEAYTFRCAQQAQHGDVMVWDYTASEAEKDFLDLVELAGQVL